MEHHVGRAVSSSGKRQRRGSSREARIAAPLPSGLVLKELSLPDTDCSPGHQQGAGGSTVSDRRCRPPVAAGSMCMCERHSALGHEWCVVEPFSCASSLPLSPFLHFKVPKTEASGIRNRLWIIPTVGCVNEYLKFLAGRRTAPSWMKTSVLAPTASQLRGRLERTAAVLAGLARNPCAAGDIAGLGCETSSASFRPALQKWKSPIPLASGGRDDVPGAMRSPR